SGYKVAADGTKVIVDGINIAAWFVSAGLADGSCANPLEAPLCSIVGNFNMGKAVLAIVSGGADSVSLIADSATLALNVQKLNNWMTLVDEGLAGNGGDGEAGGAGGAGSYGFGGGNGGQGGAYGTTPISNGQTKDGTGGNGGAGGAGGFGGGGGGGGYGFGAGQNGNGSD